MFIKVSMVCRSRLVIVYFKEKFCVSHTSPSATTRCFLSIKRSEERFKNIISLVIFDRNRSFKQQNVLSITKSLFIKVSLARCSRLVTFYFQEFA